MKRLKRYIRLLLLPVAVCLLAAACSNDDYHYPSVKLEYLTAYSGADGSLQTLRTDDGTLWPIVESTSDEIITPDSLIRIVSNYEPVLAADGTRGVKLYSWSQALAWLPIPAAELDGEDGDAPAEVLSAWMGYEYLNILLEVKQQGAHSFAFVEENVCPDEAAGSAEVWLSLFHGVKSEVQDYTKRAYLSVPLWQYLGDDVRRLTVHFSLHTSAGGLKSYTFYYDSEEQKEP